MSGPRPRRGVESAPRAVVLRVAALALTLVAMAVATPSMVPADAPRPVTGRLVYADTFPDGTGRRIAELTCISCHSPMMIQQQAKDSTAWEKTLTTMKTFGALLEAAERDTLRDYLLANFGPGRRH